jgi:hypothetical protein
MSNSSKLEQDWFIGTIEMDGCSIPIIGRGATKQEAEKEALQRVVQVWVECLELEQRLGSDPLKWWPTSISD